jgi:phosphotransacetylase
VSLIATLLGTRLPGPGTTHVSHALRFHAPVCIGDTVTVRVTVTARDADGSKVTLACTCVNQKGEPVIDGEAIVLAPVERIERPRASLPEVRISGGGWSLVDRARPFGPIRVAVAHPCDEPSLAAALDARAAGLIEPVLVAPRDKLEAIARAASLDLAGIAIEDVPHSHAAAARASALAASGEVAALMKGSLHTDELMAAVLARDAGLRTARRVSHCLLVHSPSYPRPLIITDAAINIAPTLEDKADIVRNAVDFAQMMGVEKPRVAILAAVETVNPHMQATLDAAALCKMADRGQIAGCIVDGPLALDNAISISAARTKGIVSPVAGIADILVVPDLESGNLLAKQLEYLGGASVAGIVLGARVPIILMSRADSRESRIASCAVAALIAHRYAQVNP